MNIMFFPTHVHWTPHYETELELIQNHLNEGDDIIQAVCDGQLPTCDLNLDHNKFVCALCITKRQTGKKLLTKKINNVPLLMKLTSENKKEISLLKTDFADTEELKSYHIDNFDIGYAVASSLISLLRDPNLDTIAHKQLISNYLVSAIKLYRSVQNYLDNMKIHKVYIFNGRFAHARAIFRACQSKDVECIIHERGHNNFHYELYRNILPHDLNYTEKRILNSWAKAEGMPDRVEVGAKFYLDRAQGREQSWYSFTKEQSKELLPENWRPDARNIVIYNSSEDEYQALGVEWKNPLYPNQLDAIKRIIASLEQQGDGDIHVTLRMHPNNKTMAQSELDKWYALESKILTVVHHDSPIDTYALLRNADTVLTFGSTVGIEAVFWNKPSVLVGLSAYRNLGGTYNPSSHEELIKLLLNNKLPLKDKFPAIMYGYHMNTYGIPFKYYKAEGVGSGKFKGVDLNKVEVSRFVLWGFMIKEALRKA